VSTLALAITPDGRTLAATEGPKRIAIWDTSAGKVLRRIDLEQEVYGMFMPPPAALSPDGKWLGLRLATVKPGSGALYRSFGVWDTTTGKQRWRVETRYDSDALTFSPDGKMFAEAAQAAIGLWDTETGKRLREFDCQLPDEVQYPGQTERLAFTPDNKTLIAAGCGSQVFLWDLATGAERRHFPAHRGRVFSVSVAPDGKRFATGGEDTSALVWELPQP
jgi:WD40 repeat protein